MSPDVGDAVANRLWAGRDKFGAWLLLLVVAGALFGGCFGESRALRESREHEQQRCAPVTVETADPAAVDALRGTGWVLVEGGTLLVSPGCVATYGGAK